MVLGVRCMTRPTDARFDIRREAYLRIHDAFVRHNIRFVHRDVTVEVPRESRMSPQSAEGESVSEFPEASHAATVPSSSAHAEQS